MFTKQNIMFWCEEIQEHVRKSDISVEKVTYLESWEKTRRMFPLEANPAELLQQVIQKVHNIRRWFHLEPEIKLWISSQGNKTKNPEVRL